MRSIKHTASVREYGRSAYTCSPAYKLKCLFGRPPEAQTSLNTIVPSWCDAGRFRAGHDAEHVESMSDEIYDAGHLLGLLSHETRVGGRVSIGGVS
jgi:hypothetical protein